MADGSMAEERLTVLPVGSWLYVERIRKTMSDGGSIHLPQTFKAGKHGYSAREKMNAVSDTFLVRVLATGPEVARSEAAGLEQGDHALVYSFADAIDDPNRGLWSGESSGERDRIFIRPGDIVCALDEVEL